MNEYEENIYLIGWCDYCKDAILDYEKYQQIKNKLYHDFCFEQKYNQKKELYFEQ